MIKAAIAKIEEMANYKRPMETLKMECGRVIHTVDGKQYEDKEPRPEEMKLHTLQAVADFIKKSAKTEWSADMVVVDSEKQVSVYAAMQPVYNDRPLLVTAIPLSTGAFRFDTFMPVENFIIGLQSCFCESEARDSVIEAIAGIKSEESMSYKDDGISQTISAKKGVSIAVTKQLPNPVTLEPYRTFPEIAQPESKFVLRVTDKHGEPEVGLWEADGGAWKVDAAFLIKTWLEEQLVDAPNVTVLG